MSLLSIAQIGLMLWALAWPLGVEGRTLEVGTAGRAGGYATLAAAVGAAQAGDTIRLSSGTYYECAVLLVPDLVVEGEGAGTVISDRVCEGKALLVVRGARLTVRDLVLARARSPDANGAGIRLEAPDLLVERVRFENDQVGVLDGLGAPGIVRLVDCAFERGGVVGERPSWALRISSVTKLQVERSGFSSVRGGQISSVAGQTELVGNRIEWGGEPDGPVAIEAGGALLMRDNVMVAGSSSPQRGAAVIATGSRADLLGNRLENRTGRPMTLLLDWTGGNALLEGNVVGTGDRVVADDGMFRHRAGEWARVVLGEARWIGGAAKRAVRSVAVP